MANQPRPPWRSQRVAARFARAIALHRLSSVPKEKLAQQPGGPTRLEYFETIITYLKLYFEKKVSKSAMLQALELFHEVRYDRNDAPYDDELCAAAWSFDALYMSIKARFNGLSTARLDEQSIEVDHRWMDLAGDLPSEGNHFDAFHAAWTAGHRDLAASIAKRARGEAKRC